MIQHGKFGVQEAICLIVITIATKVFFTSPSVLVRYVGTAGWYMTLISAAVATIGFTFVYLLLKRFRGKDIVEILEITLGRFLGFAFSGILSFFLIFSAASVIREFTEVIKIYVLLTSPPSYIILLLLSAVIILSYLGLETIARLSKLFAYILLAGLLSILLLSWQNYEFHRVFPIFGHGIDITLMTGAKRSSAYGEVILLSVIASSLQGTDNIKKAGYISLVISGAIISVSLLAFILAFPYFTAEEATAPMYQLAALINYGIFFQRMDPIFLFLWIICTAISITMLFYCSIAVYCNMFRIKDMKPMILPFSIILFTAAMLPKDIVEVVYGQIQKSREYGWAVFYVIPLIALIASKFRGNKEADLGNA